MNFKFIKRSRINLRLRNLQISDFQTFKNFDVLDSAQKLNFVRNSDILKEV